MLDGSCEAPGCVKPRRSPNSTYCGMHHKRMRLYSTLADPAPRVRSICTVEDCRDVVAGQGLCSRHVQRKRKYGTTDLPPKQTRPEACAVVGCANQVDELDWCKKHATRWRRHGDPATVLRGPEGPPLRDDVAYRTLHSRLTRRRGPASQHPCVDCGGPADHWSYNHAGRDERLNPDGLPYSPDLDAYDPRCAACHGTFDNRFLHVTRGGRKRPTGPRRERAVRTHCRRGHELTPDNILRGTKGQCATCTAASQRAAIERRRLAREQETMTS